MFPRQVVIILLIGGPEPGRFHEPGGFLDVIIQRTKDVDLFLGQAVQGFDRALEVVKVRDPFHHAFAVIVKIDEVIDLSIEGCRSADRLDRIGFILAVDKVAVKGSF